MEISSVIKTLKKSNVMTQVLLSENYKILFPYFKEFHINDFQRTQHVPRNKNDLVAVKEWSRMPKGQ